MCWLTKIRQRAFHAALLFITASSHSVISYSVNRKSTFDIFNFLASQHRQLPDIGPYDDEEDEVLLKSTRLVLMILKTQSEESDKGKEMITFWGFLTLGELQVWSCLWPCASDIWRRHPRRLLESTGEWIYSHNSVPDHLALVPVRN